MSFMHTHAYNVYIYEYMYTFATSLHMNNHVWVLCVYIYNMITAAHSAPKIDLVDLRSVKFG